MTEKDWEEVEAYAVQLLIRAIEAAVAEEREAILKIADESEQHCQAAYSPQGAAVVNYLIEAIRARGHSDEILRNSGEESRPYDAPVVGSAPVIPDHLG